MEKKWIAIGVVLLLSALGVLGDCCLKLAAHEKNINPLATRMFCAGAFIFGTSAFGWVYAMRYIKLSTIGLFYSLGTVLLLVLCGVVFFGETLRSTEIVGVLLALASFILLARLA